jgi:hypothetical protein
MPRYFFTVTYPDQEIDDPEGALLLSDNAAVEFARTVIDGKDHKSEDPGPNVVVKNEAGENHLSIPQQLRTAVMPSRRFPPPCTVADAVQGT